MSAIEHLTAAVANLTESVSAELNALTTALSFVGQDAAIEESVSKLNALNDALKASVAPKVDPAPVEAPTPVETPAA